MAISFGAITPDFAAPSGFNSAVAVAMATNPAVGTFLFVLTSRTGTAITTTAVADTLTNTWTNRDDQYETNQDNGLKIYDAVSVGAGANTVTATSDNFGHLTITVAQGTGFAASPFDKKNGAHTSGSVAPCSTVASTTPTNDNSLMLACYVNNQSTAATADSGAGFAMLCDNLTDQSKRVGIAYQIQGTKTARTSWMTAPNSPNAGSVDVYAPAAGAASQTPYDRAHTPQHQLLMAS